MWSSEVAAEYLAVDVHPLVMIAELLEVFWAAPTSQLAAEIRIQFGAFGLDPVSRRRLGFTVDQSGTRPERSKQPPKAHRRSRRDPLDYLRRVVEFPGGDPA